MGFPFRTPMPFQYEYYTYILVYVHIYICMYAFIYKNAYNTWTLRRQNFLLKGLGGRNVRRKAQKTPPARKNAETQHAETCFRRFPAEFRRFPAACFGTELDFEKKHCKETKNAANRKKAPFPKRQKLLWAIFVYTEWPPLLCRSMRTYGLCPTRGTPHLFWMFKSSSPFQPSLKAEPETTKSHMILIVACRYTSLSYLRIHIPSPNPRLKSVLQCTEVCSEPATAGHAAEEQKWPRSSGRFLKTRTTRMGLVMLVIKHQTKS